MNPTKTKAWAQITRTHANDDAICLSIFDEHNVLLRVQMTLEQFADAITTGRKVEAEVVRWKLPQQRDALLELDDAISALEEAWK